VPGQRVEPPSVALCLWFPIFAMGNGSPFPKRLGVQLSSFSMISVPRIAMLPNFSGERLCLLARQIYNYNF
jgi:hypothetical protein